MTIFYTAITKNKRFSHVFKIRQKEYSKTMMTNVDMREIVSLMIAKFETILIEPEDVIVKQFEETNDFYLIAKGACHVNIIDEKKKDRYLKTLRSSDYFGEISLIYGCNRTATVKSTKYSQLAKLKKVDYQEILIEFPGLQNELMKTVFAYQDRLKQF